MKKVKDILPKRKNILIFQFLITKNLQLFVNIKHRKVKTFLLKIFKHSTDSEL